MDIRRWLTVHSNNRVTLTQKCPAASSGGYTYKLIIHAPESWREIVGTIEVTIPDDVPEVSL